MKKCKHKHHEDRNEYYEDYYCVEKDIYCADCGKYLGHWAYGNYDFDYTYNYKLNIFEKIKVRFKDGILKLKYKKYDDNDDLPF